MNNWEEVGYQHHHNWMKWDENEKHPSDTIVNATTNIAISEVLRANHSMIPQSHRPLSEHTAVLITSAPIASMIAQDQEAAAVTREEMPREEVVMHARPQVQVDRSQLQQSSFETVTCYLPNRQQLLDETIGRDREVHLLCSDLQHGNLRTILTRYNQEPSWLSKDALRAFHDGQISVEQFCTLNYCFAVLTEFPGAEIQIQPLFEPQGNIDPTAKILFIDSLFKKKEDDLDSLPANFFTQAEAEEIAVTFFEKMRHALPSEQCFCYIKVSQSGASVVESPIQTVLRDKVGLRVLDSFWLENRPFRMVPSFSMIQALVEAYGKENAIAPCPRVQISKLSDFRQNLVLKTREIYVPFLGTECPKTADGFGSSDSLAFLFHDIYHCLTCSQVPYHIQREVGYLADGVAHLQRALAADKNPLVVPFVETFYKRLLDLEFSNFRPEMRASPSCKLQGLSDEEILFFELDAQLLLHTSARMKLELSTLIPLDQRKGLSEEELADLAFWDILQEEVNRKFAEYPLQSFSPPEATIRAQLFKEMRDHFYLNNDVIKKLAEQIYESGLLKRLSITPANLEHVQTSITARYGRKYTPHFLVHHLLEIAQRETGEGKT